MSARRLAAFRFPPGATMHGELIGALERMDSSRESPVVDALFVARDAEEGELQALDLATGRADGTFAALLDFRLDPARRRALTQRTLAGGAGRVPRALIEEIGASLEPGAAFFALLAAFEEPDELREAAERMGGRLVADERVDAAALADVLPALLEAP
jgi:hypothetical protein